MCQWLGASIAGNIKLIASFTLVLLLLLIALFNQQLKFNVTQFVKRVGSRSHADIKHRQTQPFSVLNYEPQPLSVLEEVEGREINKTGRYVSLCTNNINGRRLGNQLFNYAALLHVAKLTGRRVALPRHLPAGWFDRWFTVNITRVDDIQSELCPCVTIREKFALTYDRSLLMLHNRSEIAGKNILICGYFQSWRYTVGVENVLRRQLRLLPELSTAIRQYFDNVWPNKWKKHSNLSRIGIHVRAGDIKTKQALKRGFTMPQADYFAKAMSMFVDGKNRVQFIVTSNSIDWVSTTYKMSQMFDNLTVDVVFSRGHDAGFDFGLLTLCDSVIMSTGSYGWWAAWLSNKTVVYFSNWPRKSSTLFSWFNRYDYYPQNWTPVGGEPLTPIETPEMTILKSAKRIKIERQ